ncbi:MULTISPECIES: hypothetical protein [unclassified Moraxella]|uniref:hypothetical protein n=1 Tax=unclassified Moraxella TaxID=2685852 RepID=UPI003AF53E2A
MGKLATTPHLSQYPKISVADYKDRLQPNATSLTLDYRFRDKAYHYNISLTKTACNYGGYQYWFICPHCGKRVGVLYCAGLFVCRHCIGANYTTQLMQPLDKLFVKVEKIRHRLGWQAGIANGHGNRPKGMHHKTYFKLTHQHDSLVNKICGASYRQLGITPPKHLQE